MKKAVFSERVPIPGGTYSPAIVYHGIAYLSGQGSFAPGKKGFLPGDFTAQAEHTFQNLGVLLEECGSSFEQVLKMSVFITDLSHFPILNEIYPRFFAEPFPARTTVQADLVGDMLIEVDCIAAVTNED
jgi:reactive intermediate/imine deaminase